MSAILAVAGVLWIAMVLGIICTVFSLLADYWKADEDACD